MNPAYGRCLLLALTILVHPCLRAADKPAGCVDCHDDDAYPVTLAKSVHEGFACADCHAYVAGHIEEHQDAIPRQKKASCVECHEDVALEHSESIHGISLAEAIDEAANCWDCHGTHDILPVSDPRSPSNMANVPDTCGACHDNPDIVEKFNLSIANVVGNYKNSVHGRLVAEGREDAPTCTSCHATHAIKNRVQPGSTISSFHVPDTCGRCHEAIADDYRQSVHWTQARRGIHAAPVCNDCHSEHDVQLVTPEGDKKSRHAVRLLQNNTCIRCHQDPVMTERFALSGSRAGEYLDSYHGMAAMRGDEDAALCIDCHGAHKILPKKHPDSLVHPDRVVETCRKCHPHASKTFALSYAHNPIVVTTNKVEYWVRLVYIWVIILIISGMVIHNLVILVYEVRLHHKRTKDQVMLRRFTGNEVIQHLVLMLSFTVLAITGFALKYADFPLFRMLTDLGLDEPMRQFLHRGMGVVLLVLGTYHIVYLIVTASGRNFLKHMNPKSHDLVDPVQNMLFHTNLAGTAPDFHHFNYIEKAEYWALIWGTVVMGVTGFVLWVPTIVGEWAPIYLIRVCEIIHFYEAILATLAIAVWHLFFVIYHPKEYPMNLAWVDGVISLDTFKHHYREQYRKALVEWCAHRRDGTPDESLSYDVRRLINAIEERGQDPIDVFESDLAGDPALKAAVDEALKPKLSRREARKLKKEARAGK